jgi:HK97 family phage portal protein
MFLASMFKGSNAKASQDFSKWMSSMSGGSSRAGTMVTKESAMANAAFHACVTLLAESVAQLPCELYRRKKDGGREKATDHPLYDVIKYQPNRKDTAFEFYEQGQGALGTEGNDYSLIERDGAGYVKELFHINPKKVRVLKGADLLPYYDIQGIDGILPMRMVHHVRAFSFDGYVGLSPLQTNKDVIGIALATEEHASAVFSRGTTMSGVIERPKEAGTIKTTEGIERVLSKFAERNSGLANLFSVGMLQEGMQYKQLSMDNEKAQLIQSRKFNVVDICRLFKVPPHMIQDLEKASFNNIEHQGLQFVTNTLLPWLKRREAAMMRDLMLPSERKDLYIEFNVASLMRGDQKSRYESYAIGRQWGFLSVNDIRRMENMPPIIGGDKYLTPLNMVDSKGLQQSMNASEKQVAEIEEILCRVS